MSKPQPHLLCSFCPQLNGFANLLQLIGYYSGRGTERFLSPHFDFPTTNVFPRSHDQFRLSEGQHVPTWQMLSRDYCCLEVHRLILSLTFLVLKLTTNLCIFSLPPTLVMVYVNQFNLTFTMFNVSCVVKCLLVTRRDLTTSDNNG